jgi:hypothetical protein
VVLSEAAYRRLQTFAAVAGIPIEHAASDAITEWMKSTGDLVIEAVQKNRRTSAFNRKLMIVERCPPAEKRSDSQK